MSLNPRCVRFILSFLIFSASPSFALVGGQTVHGRPQIGALVLGDKDTNPVEPFCMGTLIDNDVVITAAHCITAVASDRKPVYFVLFDDMAYYNKVVLSVVHPDYNGQLTDDIALIKISPSYSDAPYPYYEISSVPMRERDEAEIVSFPHDARKASGRDLDAPARLATEILGEMGLGPGLVVAGLKTELRIAPAVCPGDSGAPVLRQVDGKTVLAGVLIANFGMGRRDCQGTAAFVSSTYPKRDWIEKTRQQVHSRHPPLKGTDLIGKPVW